MDEVDFPRDYDTDEQPLAKGPKRTKKFNKKKSDKFEQATRAYGEEELSEFKSSTWRGRLDQDNCRQGVVALACVRQVFESFARLELSDGLDARLDIRQCCLDRDQANMSDVVQVGQLITVKVRAKAETKGSYIQVSADPTEVNAHLLFGALKPGMIVTTRICEQEDTGFTCSIGLQGIHAFIDNDEAGETAPNQIRLTRVLSISKSSRFVKLSAICKSDLSETAISIAKAEIMPGQVINTRVQRLLSRGALLRSTNNKNLVVWVPRMLLPNNLRRSTNAPDDAIVQAIVTYADPSTNGNFLGASAVPALVDIDNTAGRRQLLESPKTRIGAIVEAIVVDINSKNAVEFVVHSQKKSKKTPTTEPLTIFANASQLGMASDASSKAIESKFSTGSQHTVRITGVRMLTRLLHGTCNARALKLPFVGIEDANAGDRCTMVVRGASLKVGVIGHLEHTTTRCRVPIMHALDSAMQRRNLEALNARFPKGAKVRVRVLSVDYLQMRLIVTARNALVDSPHPPITSYEEVREGDKAHATVLMVQEHQGTIGGVLVALYNSVKAWLPAKEVHTLPMTPSLGDILHVRVVDCKASEQRMTVALADRREESGDEVKSLTSDTALVESVSPVVKELLRVDDGSFMLVVESAQFGRAIVHSMYVDDCLEAPSVELFKVNAPMSKVTGCDGAVLLSERPLTATQPNTIPLCLSTSPMLIELMSRLQPPTTLAELERNQCLVGVVARKHEQLGYFVRFPTQCGAPPLVALANYEATDTAPPFIGQTVLGRVTKIDLERGRFCVSLKSADNVPRTVPISDINESIFERAVRRTLQLCKMVNAPRLGERVNATVTDLLAEGVTCKVRHNDKIFNGIIVSSNLNATEAKKGAQLADCIVAYVDSEAMLELFIVDDPTLVTDEDIKPDIKPALVNTNESIEARVVATNRDYSIAYANGTLLCVPSRHHPNERPYAHRGAHTIGDELVVYFNGEELLPGDDARLRVFLGDTQKRDEDVTHVGNNQAFTAKRRRLRVGQKIDALVTGDITKDVNGSAYATLIAAGHGSVLCHQSELPQALYEHNQPLKTFVHEMRGKSFPAIVCFTRTIKGAKRKLREVHVSLNEQKVNTTKIKRSILCYPATYRPGKPIAAFVQRVSKTCIQLDVSPLFSAAMHSEQLPVDLNSEQLKQYTFLKPFVQRKQSKTAANRTHKTIRVTLIDENRSLKKQTAVNARVIHLSSLQVCDEDPCTSLRLRPYPVVVRLPNGRRSFVHACDVAPVDNVLTRLAQLSINQIVVVRILDGRTCTMCLNEHKNTNERALVAQLDNDILQLYVNKQQASIVMAEVPTQVRTRLHCGAAVDVVIEDERARIPPTAKVHFDDSAMATLKAHLLKRFGVEMRQSPPRKRRRVNSVGSTATAHSSSDIDDVDMESAGFDWAPAQFAPKQLAAIAKKRGEDVAERGEITATQPPLVLHVDTQHESGSSRLTSKALFAQRVDDDNATIDELTQLLANEPNSARLWIQYMQCAFCQQHDIALAREIVTHALNAIDARRTGDRVNIYTAAINLECAAGSPENVEALFEKSLQQCDALTMYERCALIYENFGHSDAADNLYERLVAKMRHSAPYAVYTLAGDYFMRTGRRERAHELMQRGIKQLQATSDAKGEQVKLLTRFAVLSLKYGEVERGKTLFESLLDTYPKRTDLWLLYVDQLEKYADVQQARSVLENACSLSLSAHKMRSLYKRWLQLERNAGDEQAVARVAKKAEMFLEEKKEEEH